MKLALNILDLAEAISAKPDDIREWEKEGSLPRAVELPHGNRRWLLCDIRQWLATQRQQKVQS